MPENRNDQSRTMERSSNKRAVPRGPLFPAMLAVFLFFLMVISSVTALSGDVPLRSTNEYQPDCQDGSSRTGFMCNTAIGHYNLQNAVNSATLAPISYLVPPVVGKISTIDDFPYIVKIDAVPGLTSNNLVIYLWNISTNTLTAKATYPLTRNNTATHAELYRIPSITSAVTIVIGNTAAPGQHNVTLLTFNGTALNKVCESANFTAFDSPYMTGYDDQFNLIAYISGKAPTQTTTAALINSTCGVVSTFNQNIGTPRLGKEGQQFTPYIGITIADLYNDGNHQLIYPVVNSVVGGFKALQYNRTGSLNNEDDMSGSDSYFGKWVCSNGKCNISDTQKIGVPIWDSYHNYIITAVEKTSANSDNAGSYALLATDNYGNYLWSTQGSYFRDNCGKSGSALNTTFFQPILIDSPAEGFPQVPLRVCGACQPANSNSVYMACFKTIDGTQTSSGTYNAGANYFENFTHLSEIGDYNALLAANFVGDSDEFSRILIRDKIYDTNFNPEYDLGMGSTAKVLHVAYGDIRPADSNLSADNPAIALVSNASNKIYYTSSQNALPEYTAGTYTLSPPPNNNACGNTIPICLNFSIQNGVHVQFSAFDDDEDSILARKECNVGEVGGTFYNWTNFSSISPSNYFDAYCRYNRTGVVTLRTQISDAAHISVGQATTQDTIYNIIDSYYPFCYDSYTYSCSNTIANETPSENPNAGNTSLVPAFDEALNSAGFVGTADRAVLGIIILIVVAIAMAILGMIYHAPPQYYTGGIGFVLIGLFFLFLYLRIFQVWILVIILFIAAAMLAVSFTRTFSSGGMES